MLATRIPRLATDFDEEARGIFGVSLAEVMDRPSQKVIPTVVKRVLLYLNSDAIVRSEDLFSLPRDSPQLASLIKHCDAHGEISAKELNPPLAGALLKEYLLQLPQPLMLYSNYPSLITSIGQSPDERTEVVRSIVAKLPAYNGALLKILFLFFARAVEYGSMNKITKLGLASVFAPGIVWNQDGSGGIDRNAERVIVYMIEKYDDIFNKRSEPPPSPKKSTTAVSLIDVKRGRLIDAVECAINLVQLKLAQLNIDLQEAATMEDAERIGGEISKVRSMLLNQHEDGVWVGIESGLMPRTASAFSHCKATTEELKANIKRLTHVASTANVDSILTVSSGFDEQQGKRPNMEDAHELIDKVEGFGTKHYAFYTVCDGHAGQEAAKVAAAQLPSCVFAGMDESASDEENLASLTQAFAATDAKVLEASAKEGWKSGTTVVMAAMCCTERTLFIANLGDSEAVLVKRNYQGGYRPCVLSFNHKVTDAAEKARIKKLGGHVVFGRLFGDLAVSRAFGDCDYKRPIVDENFVSIEPYLNSVKLSHGEDDFLILTCDGIWETVSYQEAVDLVGFARDCGRSPRECAQLLVQRALDAGSKDNCTAIVVFFNWD